METSNRIDGQKHDDTITRHGSGRVCRNHIISAGFFLLGAAATWVTLMATDRLHGTINDTNIFPGVPGHVEQTRGASVRSLLAKPHSHSTGDAITTKLRNFADEVSFLVNQIEPESYSDQHRQKEIATDFLSKTSAVIDNYRRDVGLDVASVKLDIIEQTKRPLQEGRKHEEGNDKSRSFVGLAGKPSGPGTQDDASSDTGSADAVDQHRSHEARELEEIGDDEEQDEDDEEENVHKMNARFSNLPLERCVKCCPKGDDGGHRRTEQVEGFTHLADDRHREMWVNLPWVESCAVCCEDGNEPTTTCPPVPAPAPCPTSPPPTTTCPPVPVPEPCPTPMPTVPQPSQKPTPDTTCDVSDTCGTGEQSDCTGNTGYIGQCSCNLVNASQCEVNAGVISDLSCRNGGQDVCRQNGERGVGTIARLSCNDVSESSCDFNGVSGDAMIGVASCNEGGQARCSANGDEGTGIIGDYSCTGRTDANNVCTSNGSGGRGIIGSQSCNRVGTTSCRGNGFNGGVGVILDGSCNDGGRSTCGSNGNDGFGYVGSHSCNDADGDGACFNNGRLGYGVIGSRSCNEGNGETCARNGFRGRGTIHSDSCNAPGACFDNQGTIMDEACNAPNACRNNMGTITRGCCNDADACQDNSGTFTCV